MLLNLKICLIFLAIFKPINCFHYIVIPERTEETLNGTEVPENDEAVIIVKGPDNLNQITELIQQSRTYEPDTSKHNSRTEHTSIVNSCTEIYATEKGNVNNPENETLAKYVVSLRTTFVADFGEDHYCSGVIITMKTILTAAHCLFIDRKNSFDQKYLKIVAGTPRRTQRTTDTQIRFVADEIPHYKYTYAIPVHNIAILILNESLSLNGVSVDRVTLARRPLPIGAECIAVGWNLVSELGPSSLNIQHIKLIVKSEHFCSDNLLLPLTEGAFCAQNSLGTRCLASSGVPLICNGVLTGIASVSKPCNNGGPFLFMDVYAYLEWIMQHRQEDAETVYRSVSGCVAMYSFLVKRIIQCYFIYYMIV